MTDPSTRPSIPNAEELEQLPPDGGPKWNRLVFENSPYLLQHAANPVDWYPWGEEAFERAKKEDKPIFLSIGYATCHWCHVMEHESFENAEVANLLNRYFICIKVDREERPDIDQIYMTACQAATGSGGWPLTALLDHEGKPFFVGTYFPRESRYGRAGMLDLVPRLAQAWSERRDEIASAAENLTRHIQKLSHNPEGDALTSDILKSSYGTLAQSYDSLHGGFGSAPKFPTPQNLLFLLRYWRRSGDEKCLEMVETTLRKMRHGGIYDHVGYGFHRYATDPVWLLPHFEKMLYDQALMALAYLETYQATRSKAYAQTADEILTYVTRDMTSPEGGFYSAEDADSEGVEGKFYVWTAAEIESVLGPEDGQRYIALFNIKADGNFQHEAGGHSGPDNIPHLTTTSIESAELKTKELHSFVERTRVKLFERREARIHPLKDDKILTDWNGLMIAAFARAAQVLGREDYRQTAIRAADFVLNQLRTPEGRLLKRYRGGQAGLPAHLDDYAFMVWGLLELYEACFDARYLTEAVKLTQTTLDQFGDPEQGGFFLTAADGEQLIMRGKEIYDGAIPSGNSIAAMNLVKLARLTGKPEYAQEARSAFKTFSSRIRQYPMGHNMMLCAFDFELGPSFEVVIAGEPNKKDTTSMLESLRSVYIPNKIVLLRHDQATALDELAPYSKEQVMRDQRATAYVCQNFTCKAPTTEPSTMLSHLKAQ